MAKSETKKREKELLEVLRAKGVRKKVAKRVSKEASRFNGNGKAPEAVRKVAADLKSVAGDLESRVGLGGEGKTTKADRSAAAKKAAATRKRNAAKRSTTAKKAARTRAKS